MSFSPKCPFCGNIIIGDNFASTVELGGSHLNSAHQKELNQFYSNALQKLIVTNTKSTLSGKVERQT